MQQLGVRLSEAEDLGLEFWQTKSFAIMTYASTPGDCIDRVASDGGDRVLLRTTWNSKATAQGNVEQELAMPAAAFHFWHRLTGLVETKAEKRGLTWSSRPFETHPWSGPSTRQLGAVCFYNGQESTWAAQDMANVKLIELRTSEIHQCPSCGHAVFKRDNSLHMWQAHPTEPGDVTMYEGSFWDSQSTLFPQVFSLFKRSQAWSSIMAVSCCGSKKFLNCLFGGRFDLCRPPEI